MLSSKKLEAEISHNFVSFKNTTFIELTFIEFSLVIQKKIIKLQGWWFSLVQLILKKKLSSFNLFQKTNQKHSGYYPEHVSFVFWEKLQLNNFVLRSNDLYCTMKNWKVMKLEKRIQRIPSLPAFWDLEKNVLHEIYFSGTVVSPLLTRKSPTCTYIRKKSC